jgi:hypothetical protein
LGNLQIKRRLRTGFSPGDLHKRRQYDQLARWQRLKSSFPKQALLVWQRVSA